MKYIFILTCLNVIFCHHSFGQKRDLELSTSIGLGLIEGHPGFSVDGEIGLRLDPEINVGIYFNLMNSQKETDSLGPRNSFSVDSKYFIIPDSEIQNIHRSQNSIGAQCRYLLLNEPKFEIVIGAGVNYNIYKMLNFYANALNVSYESVTYYKWHDHGLGFHAIGDVLYKISPSISFGLKSRLMYFKDYNLSFMLSTKIRLKPGE